MNNWNGELKCVDDDEFRRNRFEGWLSWEFLQRGISGFRQELTPSEMGELCGKKTIASRSVVHRAIQHARCNA